MDHARSILLKSPFFNKLNSNPKKLFERGTLLERRAYSAPKTPILNTPLFKKHSVGRARAVGLALLTFYFAVEATLLIGG